MLNRARSLLGHRMSNRLARRKIGACCAFVCFAGLGLRSLPAGAEGATANPPAATSVTPCTEALVQKVQARYDGIRDLRARFVQTTWAVSLGIASGVEDPAAERSSGRVVFAKPGRMRWAYETPEETFVVSDGQILWIYDAETREAQRLPVGSGFLSGAAIQFLLGDGDLREAFSINEVSCSGSRPRLGLVPREPSSYERLEIAVEATTGFVVETRIFDLFGNETRVELDAIEINQNPEADLFRFRPPPGSRVIELPETTPSPFGEDR